MTVASPAQKPTGIASIGLQFPPLAMAVEELASLRGQDPEKYTIALGCSEMSLCPPGYGVVELATEASRRALDRWGGDPDRIGAELLTLEAGPQAEAGAWEEDVRRDLDSRKRISRAEYEKLRD